jgi:hypothetical protein
MMAKKKVQKSLKDHSEGNNFFILDGTKHNPENFDISYFIIPK